MIEIDYKIRFTTVHNSSERGALSIASRIRYLVENALRADGIVFKSPPNEGAPVDIDITRMEHIHTEDDENG